MHKLSIVVMLTLILAACGTSAPQTSASGSDMVCPDQSGFQCLGYTEDDIFLYIASTVSVPAASDVQWIPVGAAAAEQAVNWTAVVEFLGGTATTVAYLAPIAGLVVNPNIIQQLAEGDPYIRSGDTVRVYRLSGAIEEFTIPHADAQAVEDAQTNVDVRSQCLEQEVGCSATPTGQRLIFVIDDEKRVRDDLALFLAAPTIRVITFPSCALAYQSVEIPNVVIVDGNLAGEYGWVCVSDMRVKWPPPYTKIVAYSAANEYEFAQAKVDRYVNKAGSPREFIDLVRSLLP